MRRRHVLPLSFALAALLAGARADAKNDPNVPNPMPDLDFEENLRGWTSDGNAFASPVVLGDVITVEQLFHLPVGGDYWKRLTYPLGHHGQRWLSTCWKRPSARGPHNRERNCDAMIGSLTSKDFVISAVMKHFSALVGGANNPHRIRVELQVKATNASDATELDRMRIALGTIAAQIPSSRDGAQNEYVIVAAATGAGVEDLHQFSVGLPSTLVGKTARLRIVDFGALQGDHINVDDIRLGPELARMGNVWGFADYHAHPMAHISFGGLKGIRTIWGAPGHAWTAYASDPNAIRRDFPQCNASHFGGRVAPLFINGVESQLPGFEIFMGFTRDHNPFGGDATALREFQAFPSFEAGAHLQYHITQIRRAYEGGLRLMSALVVNNEMAEFVMSRTVDKGNDKAINLTPERDVLRAAINATKQLVVLNNDWMDIAYTPHDARRIIRSGKLAVILGTELDHTGSLYPGKAAADEVAELFRMGIRQITPIHAIDTNLGGAALFQDMYNTGNYQANKKWFNAKDNTACGKGTSRGECVLFHLDDSETEAIIGDSMAITLGDGDHERHPWRATHDTPQYKNKAGVTNTDGLKGDGFAYLQAAMQRGMLIDISHMSDVGAGQAVGVAQKPDMNVTLHPYPLMISHAGFREQMFRKDYTPWRDDLKGVCTVDGTLGIGTEADCASKVKDWLTQKGHTSNGQILPGTINDGFLPSEFDVPVSLAQAVAALGGVVGPFVAQEPIDDAATLAGTNFPLPFTNDCAMTSKGFAAAYQYARKMGFSSVGIASDFGMHMTMAPRFGGMACGAWRKAGPWDRQAFWVIERTLNPSQYKMGNQQYGVVYSDAPTRAGVTPGTNAPLKPYKMATRTFDINVDGLANYGLMPDLIQDMANVSQGALDLNPFFASAEGYIQMWEKAWYAVGCKPGRGLCEAPPTPVEGCTARDDSVCKGLGPDSFNHGAPLVELAERTDRCSQGIVQFEGTAVVGTNALKEGDWAILQVANPKFAWHCGTQDNTDWTECPSGTRYVRVERSSSQDAVKGQAIHTACLAAPLGSGPPPTQTVVYLDTRKEKCGRKTLRVHTGDTVDNSPGRLTDTNQVAVRKVNVKTFRTFCEENPGDASPIDTDLPAGTNLVKVRRLDIKGDHPHVDARRFVLECYHQN